MAYVSYHFQLVMSLSAKSFELRLYANRKGGTGDMGGHTQGVQQHGLWA